MPEVPTNPNMLRDHLANERTFLAWLRTGITIIALGFVVAKFGILLREIRGPTSPQVHQLTARLGAAVGVALVLAGILGIVLAMIRFLRIRRDIEYSVVRFSPALDILMAAIVGSIAVVMVIYLLITA